jgi:alginate O-acetyltransferase complex protein AlgJ
MIRLSFHQLIERTLAGALFLAFVMPLTLTVVRKLPRTSKPSRWLDRHWIGKPHLSGVIDRKPNVPLTWRSLANGEFQKRKAIQFSEMFAGRELFIRFTGELWYRLFHDTADVSHNIVFGQHDILFGKHYLLEYFLFRGDKSAFEPWVKDLRRLQDFCRSIGMGFVIVISPSKATIYPEDAPAAWLSRYVHLPRAYDHLKALFRENGIVFVDGVDLTKREKLKGPPVPLFPKGGVHWNARAAFITANAIHARFAEQNKPIRPIELDHSDIAYEPAGDEFDLLEILNLARPWRYPVERFTIKRRTPPPGGLTMAAIGGSFTYPLARDFSMCGQYSDINFYFYYKMYKTREIDGHSNIVRKPSDSVDFRREIFAADCLLLELNETTGAAAPEQFLSVFLKDALAHLPDPAAPRPPFHPD